MARSQHGDAQGRQTRGVVHPSVQRNRKRENIVGTFALQTGKPFIPLRAGQPFLALPSVQAQTGETLSFQQVRAEIRGVFLVLKRRERLDDCVSSNPKGPRSVPLT